jgi:hypothetical protein
MSTLRRRLREAALYPQAGLRAVAELMGGRVQRTRSLGRIGTFAVVTNRAIRHCCASRLTPGLAGLGKRWL